MSTIPTQFCSPACGHVFPVVDSFDKDGNCSAHCPRCLSPMTITAEEMAEFHADVDFARHNEINYAK